MKSILLYFLLSTFLFVGCNRRREDQIDKIDSNNNLLVLNLETAINNAKDISEFSLGTIADSITYVLLESNGILLKSPHFSEETSKYYYFIDRGTFFRCRLNGKEIERLFVNGRGPNEIPVGSLFSYCPQADKILVSHNYSGLITQHRTNGEYEKTIRGKERKVGDAHFWHLNTISDSLIVCSGVNVWPINDIPVDGYIAAIFDYSWKKVNSIPIPFCKQKGWRKKKWSYNGTLHPTWTDNNLLVTDVHGDTVYIIKPDGTIAPRIVLDKGQYKAPDKVNYQYFSFPEGQEVWDQYCFQRSPLFESPNSIIIAIAYNNIPYIVYYNKVDSITEAYKIDSFISNKGAFGNRIFKIPNDLDGGLPFFPHYTNRSGMKWIKVISPIELKRHFSSDSLGITNQYSQNKYQELRQLSQKLSEDDNSLFMIVHLKQ